jgi:hypothetical protein
MTGIHRRGALLAAPALIGGLSGRAHAQAWPARQVRIVVGFAAGGATDLLARRMQPLFERRGYQLVIENLPGAGSTIASFISYGIEKALSHELPWSLDPNSLWQSWSPTHQLARRPGGDQEGVFVRARCARDRWFPPRAQTDNDSRA